MKKLLLTAMMVCAGLMMNLQSVSGQDVPPAGTPSITLDVIPGSTISFNLASSAAGTLWIDAGDGNYTNRPASNQWNAFSVTSIGDYITLYSDIVMFQCLWHREKVFGCDPSQLVNLEWFEFDGNNITSIGVSNNKKLLRLYVEECQLTHLDAGNLPQLIRLYCSGNGLRTLDLSNNTALYLVYTQNNLLEPCALDSLYMSLDGPSSTVTNRRLYLKVSAATNPGLFTSNTSLAVDKDWRVLDYVSSQVQLDLVGDGTGCDHTVSVGAPMLNSVEVYPNPSQDDVFITANGSIKKVEVNSLSGNLIKNYENINRNHFRFNVQDLPKGTYFVRVVLNNDFFVKKLIVG